jgi:hypothetical protein
MPQLPSIRGHQGQFNIYQDGGQVQVVAIKTVDVNQDSGFITSNYVGDPLVENDQSIDGFSGTAEMEVKDNVVETFLDALITNNLNGIGVSAYTFVVTENYPNGTISSYAYFDVVWKLSRRQAGQQEKVTKKLDFKAAGRLKLA